MHLILLKLQYIIDFNMVLFLWFIKFLRKYFLVTRDRLETLATCGNSAIKSEIISNQQFAEELQRQIIK